MNNYHNIIDCFEIEDIAYGAKGITRKDGKVYFAPNTLPGDHISARILCDKKNYAELTDIKIQKRSPLRQPNPCSVGEICGGCQWLSVDTGVQRDWKKKFLRTACEKIGKFPLAPDLIEIWPSTLDLGYRNRIRLRGKKGNRKLGYLIKGSKNWTPIDQCYIASSSIQKFISQWHQENFIPHCDFQLEIQELPSSKSKVLVTILKDGPIHKKTFASIEEKAKKQEIVAWIGKKWTISRAPFFLMESHLGVDFYIKPGHFYQINIQGNRLLREEVKQFIEERKSKKILDLFCGCGNLTLTLAHEERSILGIESHPSSISAATYTVEQNQLPGNIKYIQGDARKILPTLKNRNNAFDAIIADPPREGLKQCLSIITQLLPATIVLIGCEPNHFARDLGKLVASGYHLTRLIVADFFPQTFHLEAIAFLTSITKE